MLQRQVKTPKLSWADRAIQAARLARSQMPNPGRPHSAQDTRSTAVTGLRAPTGAIPEDLGAPTAARPCPAAVSHHQQVVEPPLVNSRCAPGTREGTCRNAESILSRTPSPTPSANSSRARDLLTQRWRDSPLHDGGATSVYVSSRRRAARRVAAADLVWSPLSFARRLGGFRSPTSMMARQGGAPVRPSAALR